jgi:hypothetical protein
MDEWEMGVDGWWIGEWTDGCIENLDGWIDEW